MAWSVYVLLLGWNLVGLFAACAMYVSLVLSSTASPFYVLLQLLCRLDWSVSLPAIYFTVSALT